MRCGAHGRQRGGGLYLIGRAALAPGSEAGSWLWVLVGVGLLNGVTITAVGIVAEYVVVLARQGRPAYHVQQVIGGGRHAAVHIQRAVARS